MSARDHYLRQSFFYPDLSATSQMLSDQAFALSRAGHSVIVIASRQDYQNSATPLPANETIDGVEVYRVTTLSFGRFRLLGRAIDDLMFYLGAGWRLL